MAADKAAAPGDQIDAHGALLRLAPSLHSQSPRRRQSTCDEWRSTLSRCALAQQFYCIPLLLEVAGIAFVQLGNYCCCTKMTSVPGISVVLPNFNHGAFVGEALRALLSQSLEPDEIIVVDDASTDNSRSVIEGITAKNPTVRLLVNPQNVGVIRALNRGLELASGCYIYLAAADDW